MPPDPTDAELDELLSQRSHWNPAITRYAKALRACRREADVVRENLDSFRAPVTSRSDDTVKLSLAGRVFALGERDEACRARAKAKDAVIEALGGVTPQETMHAIAWITGVQSSYAREGVTEQAAQLLSTAAKCLRVLDKALAALEKKPDD